VHQFLFQDGVRAAHVALPMIGDLVHLQATFCTAGAEGLPDETADRLIADILPHPLSLAQFFLPAALPERWTTLRSVAGELRASCATAGTTLSFVISTHGRPTLCAFDVVGSAGSIHLDLYHGYAVIEPGAVSRARKLARPFAHAMRTATAATFNSGRRLWRGEAAYPGLWQLVDAFYGSIRSHGPAPIPAHEAIEIAHLRDRLAEDAGLLDRNIALGRTA
jgi:predicted dehydrogenase